MLVLVIVNGRNGEMITSLEQLEKLATKYGSTSIILSDGKTFTVTKVLKSKHRRFAYQHGNRNMARDEVERDLIKE